VGRGRIYLYLLPLKSFQALSISSRISKWTELKAKGFLTLFSYVCDWKMKQQKHQKEKGFGCLTVANSLVILSKGIPQTMATLGWKHFLSDTGCRLVFDFHRVGRVGVLVPSACSVSSRHNDQPQELQVVRAEPISSQISQAFHRSVLDPEQPGNYYFSLYVTGMWNSKSITKSAPLFSIVVTPGYPGSALPVVEKTHGSL
ncbi:hypothetical protein EI555_014357, partial [Monodon monoceros]